MALSLLAATPQLNGGPFERAALLMAAQAEGGGLGLTINRPAAPLSDLQPQVGARWRDADVYFGGPVELETVSYLYRQTVTRNGKALGETLTEGLWLSRQKETLQALLESQQDFMLLLGYAGWRPDQLERELRTGLWLWGEVSEPEVERLLWHTPAAERWEGVLRLLMGAGQFSGSARA